MMLHDLHSSNVSDSNPIIRWKSDFSRDDSFP